MFFSVILYIILYSTFIKIDNFIGYNFINVILYASSFCLLAPIGEELYFRFVIWNIFSKRFGYITTSVLTLLIWYILHYESNIKTIFGIVPLGFILTYIRIKTENIFIRSFVHAWNNIAFLIIAFIF
ncbi:lysostaphin resistance A-like protein [Methylobacterium sp. SyP6R]|uniref:CPBP family intramembrane glutamic endopeptidase n=1 Tax=Methylobacterium sp. SyP6R TaxID=2718876 RepID=UPI003FA5D735